MCKNGELENRTEDRKLKFGRLNTRVRETEDDQEDGIEKGYEESRLTK